MDLRRDSLLERIEANGAPLVLVQAPAGYGKSTLLRQFVARQEAAGATTAWVTPATQDADFARCIQMITDACKDMVERSGGVQPELPGEIGALLSAIVGPAVLVLDDFHQFGDPRVDTLLQQLVDGLPEGKRIAVATRQMPNIASGRLKLAGRAIVLGSIDLRFELGEAYQFLAERCRLGLEEVRRLHGRIDGWPAALQFISLSLNTADPAAASVPRSGMTGDLVDYLAREVFFAQDAARREALLRICLPERLCARMVDELTGGKGGARLLRALQDEGLFLDPVGGEGDWFRFHPLFGDFLRSQLRSEIDDEALAARHAEIAEWFVANDMREIAIGHFLAADMQDRAAQCLGQVADRLVREDRLGLLVSLLDRLDDDVVRANGELLAAGTIARGFRREFDKAFQLLDWAETALEKAGDDPVARAELEVRRCFTLAAQDRVEEMGEAARDAQRWLSDDKPFLLGPALNAHAFWLGAQSQFAEAHDLLLRALPLHEKAGSFFGWSYAESIRASLKVSQGDVGEAIEDMRRAMHRMNAEGPPGLVSGGVIAAHLGDALYETGELDEAERIVSAYLPHIQQQSIVDPHCLATVTLARIATIRGRTDFAHELLEGLIASGHRYSLSRLVECGRAELVREAVLAGDLDTAQRRLRALGGDARLPTEGQYLFASSELEAQRICHIRYLIHAGQHGEARAMLQAEVRTATLKHRNRRLARLKVLQAISLDAEGQHAHARRVMTEAIALAAPGRMRRVILDEGPAAQRLLSVLAAENMQNAPGWAEDAVAAHARSLSGGTDPRGEDDEEPADGLSEPLTRREIDILGFLALGHSNRDLAQRLAVSQNTVKFHLRNIFAKLGATNRMQAVQAARHFQLID